MGRIFRKCETRLQRILTCTKRQKIAGTMKTVYLVCLVAAGAAFAFAADHCNRNDGGCVPVVTDPDPTDPPKPINCPVCQVRAIAEKCTNPDKFVPTCNGDKFAKYQYDEAKDEHFCVYIDGTEITEPVTRKPGKGEGEACASFPDMPEAAPTEGPSKTPCLDKRRKLEKREISSVVQRLANTQGFLRLPRQRINIGGASTPAVNPSRAPSLKRKHLIKLTAVSTEISVTLVRETDFSRHPGTAPGTSPAPADLPITANAIPG